mmetsp:Transcript_12449/g.33964  ORF Transcript_12449/g.33964 Transcript_12449/m.33964 type:complete len:166 (+) Transcript_12449:571-1068(+)
MPLSAIASKRIQSELREWQRAAPEGFALEDVSGQDMTNWCISMQGPECLGGPGMSKDFYVGKVYRVRVSFNEQYPIQAPEVVFLDPSPVHPHIYSNGHICLDVLYDGQTGGWSPALTISKIVLSLQSMLASNTSPTRPPGDSDYCQRVGTRSPKLTRWVFEDDKV